jgi:hypothetical protein
MPDYLQTFIRRRGDNAQVYVTVNLIRNINQLAVYPPGNSGLCQAWTDILSDIENGNGMIELT